ncbi:MAG: SLBB domain-containing protein [Candidatus Krumholzibacteriota bacterium]|nr:SLBB domain-containing protein [Candidatus Krumholzibacteriota bacterium]
MFRRIILAALSVVVIFSIPDAVRAQTEAQKEAYRKYIENQAALKDSEKESNTVEIYNDSEPVLPPERHANTTPTRYGIDVFSSVPAEFVSSSEIPVPSDYTLGPGDHLVVNLWGSADLTMELVIDREGKVFVPKAGELVIWGLKIEEAEKRLAEHYSRIYSKFEMNLILGKIRSVTVYVSGEVMRPGAYTVSSLYTLFNTLHLAGGPTERGSLRRVRLVRGTSVVKVVDLYELLMNGKGEDVRLESNDIIFVPVAGPLVTVAGEVKREGVYEILGGERVLDAIELAGGLRSSAYLEKVELIRFEDNLKNVLIDLDITGKSGAKKDNIEIIDGDRIKVRSIHDLKEDVVLLQGKVKYPGEYSHHIGMKITDLIGRGMLLPDSYTERVFVTRIFNDRRRSVFQVALKDLLSSIPVGQAGKEETEENGKGVPEELSESKLITRDMILYPGDIIEVYSTKRMHDTESVSIEGEIRLPGEYIFADDMVVSDLIYQAGGIKKEAYLLRAELARLVPDTTRSSEILMFDLGRVLTEPHGKEDILLYPGDALFIREIPNYSGHERVTIAGEVLFPGTYVIEQGVETLTDLIERAGGFTGKAFLPGALFERGSIVDELRYRHVEDVILSLREAQRDSSGAVMADGYSVNYNSGKMNRIIIDLETISQSGERADDIVLRAGDRITIPPRPSGVNVLGAVASSGTIKYFPGKKTKYYIDRAGGFSRRAASGELRILKADGRVLKRRALSQVIELGDAIIVPEKVIRDRDWMKILQTSVSIIASALTTVYIVTKM